MEGEQSERKGWSHAPRISSSGRSGASAISSPPKPHPTSATVMGFVSGRGRGCNQEFRLELEPESEPEYGMSSVSSFRAEVDMYAGKYGAQSMCAGCAGLRIERNQKGKRKP